MMDESSTVSVHASDGVGEREGPLDKTDRGQRRVTQQADLTDEHSRAHPPCRLQWHHVRQGRSGRLFFGQLEDGGRVGGGRRRARAILDRERCRRCTERKGRGRPAGGLLSLGNPFRECRCSRARREGGGCAILPPPTEWQVQPEERATSPAAGGEPHTATYARAECDEALAGPDGH